MYRAAGKRLLDLAIACPAVIVLSPLFGMLGLLVRLYLGRPIIFRQKRPGLHGRIFTLYKFRTMVDRRNSDGTLLPDADRLVGFGRFLRSTSLDELPELVNVIRGDMSLVGPRPLLVQYLERYTPQQLRRHEVRPGITGLGQVTGRNAASWGERFARDIAYVDSVSLRLDLAIIGRTVLTIFRREGINEPGSVTAEEFMGENTQS